ncbi:MAG: hypothetical protein EA341_07795 [Mongoliibacter sp.]|uniref:nucleotidyl transferase AbiEii/AbiGii toxin family protein n=1 Tax=Mongoliibacter sp. TaxID=2022438 RepID=UPI0012F2D631|nr:nucleotidyl transferase AbiEii/AbiGii toxin family protein [Mongoliibacter sp.]TVP50320.1 MAG: hypothetical protein EA341_07795 [Mongoliibacter sp.]
MLQIETVEPGTFSLLKKLQAIPELQEFSLVGGTALALIYGHRISVDLDLFSCTPIQHDELVERLQNTFGDIFLMEQKPPKFALFAYIDNIKVDFVNHPFPLIRPIEVLDGIRFFSTEDIIAMKVQAILGRAKKKDFWDIAELLQHYSVEDFIMFHQQKYQRQNLLISVPQALIYFEEAEEGEDPVSLKGQSWKKVKKFIQKKVREYLH